MKILTIDMDFITAKYARLTETSYYSNFAYKRWDDLFFNTPVHPNDLKIDPENLMYIIEIFTRAIEFCDNVTFGLDHDAILYDIETQDNIQLINIDQHHDIAYTANQILDIQKYNLVTEASWVWWLINQKKLKSYTWISSETSQPYNKSVTPVSGANIGVKEGFETQWSSNNLPNFNIPFKQTDKIRFINWEEYKFDYIFICESKQYVFPEHWFYVDLLKIIYKNYHKKLPKFNDKKYMYDRSKTL